MKKSLTVLLTFVFALLFFQCKKESEHLNITLYDKSSSVIESYVSGKWKLQYTRAGFSGYIYYSKYNDYLQISDKRIVMGNDSSGIVMDTVFSWNKTDLGNGTFTYLLNNFFVNRINNDTLILSEYLLDGSTYHYTKFK